MTSGVTPATQSIAPFRRTQPPSQQSSSIARAQLLHDQPWLGLNTSTSSPAALDICEQCARVEFDNLPPVNEGAIPHHKYGDLVESAERCQLCRVIQYAAHEQRKTIIRNVKHSDKEYRWGPAGWITGPVPDIDSSTRVWIFGAWKAAATTMPPHWLAGFGCMLSARDPQDCLLPNNADGAMEKRTFIPNPCVRICTTYDDAMGSIVPGRVRQENASSDANFQLVERWMSMCDKQHDCQPMRSALPDRLIAIDPTEDRLSLRLVETHLQTGHYVALSHSWGSCRRRTLTTANIDDMKGNIAIQHLPKTFCDAANITRRLGLRYLWIDSLCIIQDSPSDWAKQSMLMASIYAGATITICATGSSSDDDGVLLARSAVYNPPDNEAGLRDMRPSAMARAVVNTSSGQHSKLTFFPQRFNDGGVGILQSALDPVSQDPLHTRAWAFQERILSPRKLIYGADQLYWECKRSLFSEDGARGQAPTPLLTNVINSERTESGRERRQNGWPRLVSAYSQGRLTYLTDKLTALAGLASEIGKATLACYYAGVWSSHIWTDLLWHVHLEPEASPTGHTYVEDFKAYQEKYHGPIPVSNPQKLHPWLEQLETWRQSVCPEIEPLPPDTSIRPLRHNADIGEISRSGFTLARASPYVAPTWSFASIDAPVTFPYAEDTGLGTVAECLSVWTEPDGQSAYGKLKGGSLTIKGPLLPLRPPPEGSKTFFFGSKASVDVANYPVEIERIFFDVEPTFPCHAMVVGQHSALLIARLSEVRAEVRRLYCDREEDLDDLWIRVGVSDALYGLESFWAQSDQCEWTREVTIL